MHLFLAMAPEALGVTELVVNSYARKDSPERWFFRLSEILILLEVVNHLAKIQSMKSHVFVFAVIANIICFWVIPYYPAVSLLISILARNYCVLITLYFFLINRMTGLSTGS